MLRSSTQVERCAIALLISAGPDGSPADLIGAGLWPHSKRKTTSMGGGGDFAAQMLLGRLRRRGWARVLPGSGSSRWTFTPAGRAELALVTA
jgi:hypothetical protein